jgi:RNA polymerase sigma factor (sigma-70 family)
MDGKITRPSSAAELIEAVRVGNQTALKQLYDLESRRLYGIALRIVRRPETAADVLQDAFIQIWQNARSYSTERGDATAWLIGIVRYRALDAVRKLRREILSGDPTLGDGAEDFDIIEEIDRTRRSHSVLQPLSAASKVGYAVGCCPCGVVSNHDPREPRRTSYSGGRIRPRRSRHG